MAGTRKSVKSAKSKAKSKAIEAKEAKEAIEAAVHSVAADVSMSSVPAGDADAEDADEDADGEGDDDENPEGEDGDAAADPMEARRKKLSALRARMRASHNSNLAALRHESTATRASARDAARREKQLRLAETLRLDADAASRGGDPELEGERRRNWEYTIEENEAWEAKKRRKERGADFEFHDEEHQARRRYKKDLAHIKPDLTAYNKQKALALGVGAGGESTSAVTAFDPSGGSVISYEQRQAAESLYRDANTLLYADNTPDDAAIDRVVHKLNIDQDKRNKFSRKRLNEDEGDVTYINERNRVFNKKIARFYDKYTSEIRASFERGTAL